MDSVSLTQPKLSIQIPESFDVLLPPSEEIHRAVLPPLEDLHKHTDQVPYRITSIQPKVEERFTDVPYRPASSVCLHVAVNHNGRPEFPLRENLHLA